MPKRAQGYKIDRLPVAEAAESRLTSISTPACVPRPATGTLLMSRQVFTASSGKRNTMRSAPAS